MVHDTLLHTDFWEYIRIFSKHDYKIERNFHKNYDVSNLNILIYVTVSVHVILLVCLVEHFGLDVRESQSSDFGLLKNVFSSFLYNYILLIIIMIQ